MGLIAPQTYKIQWIILGEVVPKARPRVGKNRAILPPKYAAWKDGAISEFKILAYQSAQDIRDKLPLSRVSITVNFYNSLSPKADLDNGVGSILDALVQAGVLKDDSRNHVVKLTCEFHSVPCNFRSISSAQAGIVSNEIPRTEITIEPA